jgi:hypothetical protein
MVKNEVLTQISLFAENKPGRMSKVFEILRNADVDILAFTIAEAGAFGVFHLITSEPDRAYKALSDAGFTVTKTSMLGVELLNLKDSLYTVSKKLAEHGISVDYAYMSLSSDGNPYLVLRVNDIERAKIALE